jgi:hypothetical protein
MASTTHADKGILDGNTSGGSTRSHSEFEDEKKPVDSTPQAAVDEKFVSSAVDNEQHDDIIYPEGVTFILIMVSLLLCVFLMALDQVWRLLLLIAASSTYLTRERQSWLQLFRRSQTSFVVSTMCLGMARLILLLLAAFSRRGGKLTSTSLLSTLSSLPLEFLN